MDILIRPETPADYAAIHEVTKRAFAPMPYADGNEQLLIGKLRDAGALALSLVAESDGVVVGQITFSPAFAVDGSRGWYALGPVSVEPALKHQSIGSKLIRAGIAWLQDQNAAGCILIGNPTYYSRFGFRVFSELAPAGMPAEYYQVLPLALEQPNVIVEFHPLFQS